MITVTFSIITDNGQNAPSLGFLPIAVRFGTPEEAKSFLEERSYKPDPNNPAIMQKPFVRNDGTPGFAFAVISQVTEPEGFFEDEINPPQQGELS